MTSLTDEFMASLGEPSVTPGAGFINFAWRGIDLRVMAERVTDAGVAELSFYLDNGNQDAHLLTTRVNLLSTSGMDALHKRLKQSDGDIHWPYILKYITRKTLDIVRAGEKAVDIWPSDEVSLAPSYLLEPICYLNHPAVIFGDYGSAKSLLALAISYITQLPYTDNALGLIPNSESNKVLYLDYEDDQDSFKRRWGAISKGFGHEMPMPICYRRMTATLSDSVEQLQAIILSKAIRLVVIDSLGPAARGNLNDTEPAIKYHTALRQLGVTSLTLAHNSKGDLVKNRTIFGSVFFTNLARSVWEVKAEQEIGEDEVIVSLKQTKANLSKLHLPLGFKVLFTDDTIKITKADLKDTNLSGELPLPWRIKNILNNSSMTTKEIAGALDKNEGHIANSLSRMYKKGEVTKLAEHKWGLPYKDLANAN